MNFLMPGLSNVAVKLLIALGGVIVLACWIGWQVFKLKKHSNETSKIQNT